MFSPSVGQSNILARAPVRNEALNLTDPGKPRALPYSRGSGTVRKHPESETEIRPQGGIPRQSRENPKNAGRPCDACLREVSRALAESAQLPAGKYVV